ncbi:MAG: PTS sugar transporter subunit IIA [Enterobacter hormaechei]
MLKKWIYDTTIILQDSVESWPQALELCAKPLLDLQVIAPEYVTAIIEQHHTLGPYYVLAPGLAMPCATGRRGERTWPVLLKLKQGVSFGAGEFDPSM